MSITKKHTKIIDEWVQNEVDETELIQKYRISFKKLSKLLNYKQTKDEIDGRLEVAKKRSQLLIAKYLPVATAKLIELCNSDNNETSRKACMDLIKEELQEKFAEPITQTEAQEPAPKIDNETASTILAVLAEKKKRP
ncbi:MAG: hypothetical protein LLF92_00130 [Planctomycetaceae bacterium]|nr:hypothetical protein [Planctomycetaceae bacterium]